MRRGLTRRWHRHVIDVAAIRSRYVALSPFPDERTRRLVAASEAKAAGHGGIAATVVATGVARSTIGRGLVELITRHDDQPGRVRRPGAGRKSATTKQEPGLLAALQELVTSAIRGDPEAALLWVSRSGPTPFGGSVNGRGFEVSHKLVGRLLAGLADLQAKAQDA